MLTKESLDRTEGKKECFGLSHTEPLRQPVCGRMEGDADPVTPSEGWLIAALVGEWVGREPTACSELRRTEFQFFLPQVRILVHMPHQPAQRRLVPAFPGYLFVLPPAPEAWHDLKRTRGVAGVLHHPGAPGRPFVVPAVMMGRMLARVSKLGVFEDMSVPAAHLALPLLPAGARVAITGGYLAGQTGEVALCKASEVRIRLDSLGIVATLPRSRVQCL